MQLSRIALVSIACLAFAARGQALQVENMTLISPITNQPFETVGIPIEQLTGDALADMGYDDDGCRHTSGLSEYTYYVATDPFSYFSALTAEWDPKTGRFGGQGSDSLPPDMKQWVDKQFNTDWVLDYNRLFQLEGKQAKASGRPAPERKDFVISQDAIPIEKRYRYALMCYEKRGARPAAMAKTALMGAWALRTFLNVPIGHQALDGGYQEVNDKIVRQIKEGEAFQLTKWLPIYKKVVDDGGLTNEGTLVAVVP